MSWFIPGKDKPRYQRICSKDFGKARRTPSLWEEPRPSIRGCGTSVLLLLPGGVKQKIFRAMFAGLRLHL